MQRNSGKNSPNRRIRKVKKEIRILGVDDGPFTFDSKETVLVGCVFRAGLWLDCVLTRNIAVDGLDCTEKIIDMCSRRSELRVVMLDGITFAGFNIADIRRIYSGTGVPVIAVTRKMPDMAGIKKALSYLDDFEKRSMLIKKAGTVRKLGDIHYQSAGIDRKDAEEIIRISCTRSKIPEPVRVAHLIATAMVVGESHGRA